MYDVITVGGGPAGACASYLLAKEGFNVLLLDKGQPGGKLCTGVASEETFQVLSISRTSILRSINSIEFIAPSGESFTYKHTTPFAHVVDRMTFDTLLIDMARYAGTTVQSGMMASSLEVDRSGVRVGCGKNGKFVAKAKVLILATGLNRRLLRMVGLKPPAT